MRCVPKQSIPFSVAVSHSDQNLLAHVHGMLDQMEAMLADDTPEQQEKFLKWYGFLQCALVASGVYSLDETRAHNRST